MSRSDTWMPLYVADYLRDTTHLSAEEHGGYLLLLMGCWTRGGALPVEALKLAAIARLSPAAWKRSGGTIMEFFVRDGAGWTHKRVAAELQRAADLSEKRRNAGARGGEAKAQKAGKPLANAKQETEQKPTHARVAPPSPSPPPSEVSEAAIASSATTRRARPRQAVPDGWTPTDAGRRHAIERGMPPEAIEGQVERFRDHHAAKGSIFANVDAAWRTWAGNFNDFKPQLRVAHDRDASRNDRRSSAFAERLSDVGAAGEAAARAWRPPGSA